MPLSIQILFLILPSVLLGVCEAQNTMFPDFFMYETPYYPPVTQSLSVLTTAKPHPKRVKNFYQYKISGNFTYGHRIVIKGSLRETTISNNKLAVIPLNSTPENHKYVYRLPQMVHIGDSITISGLLQENARTLRFELIHRKLQRDYNVDYVNVPIDFTATIGPGTDTNDTFRIASISETTASWDLTPEDKVFVDETFKFAVGVNPRSRSSKNFTLDLHCNDKLIQSVDLHNLERIGYLQISGHYSTVESLKFNFGDKIDE